MSLRNVNLNLIPVLQTLFRLRNVSHAARELHLTQPAVSAALAKLRLALHDPLLVPVGRRMQLTPRALELVEPVEQACAALNAVLAQTTFDARKARRRFIISTSDYSSVVLAPPLIKVLAKQAPGVSLHFVNQSTESIEKYQLGEVDLMFMPRPMLDALGYTASRTLHILRDQFVYAVGPGHALYSVKRPTALQIGKYPQIRFQPAHLPAAFASANALFKNFGVPAQSDKEDQRDVVLVEQFSVLPIIALLSGSMILAPRRLIEALQPQIPMRILDAGLEPVEMCLTWHAVHDADPAHRWFRELVQTVVGDDRFASGRRVKVHPVRQ